MNFNFGNFDVNSLASLGEHLSRDIGVGFEQLKKGVEDTLKQQDDQQEAGENDPDEWGFSSIAGIDSLVKTLVGDGPGDGPGEERQVDNTSIDGGEPEDVAVTSAAESPAVPTRIVEEPRTGTVPPSTKERTKQQTSNGKRKSRRKSGKAAGKVAPGVDAAEEGAVIVTATETQPSAPPGAVPGPSSPRDSSPPSHQEPAVDESAQQRILELEERVAKQAKELAAAKRRAIKEREEKQEAEMRLKSKDEEIDQVMAEGEALSKKQLVLETNVKELKTQLGRALQELAAREAALEVERQRNQDALSCQSQNESKIASMKSEHEETVKMLRAEVVANERKLATLSKDGSSDARKLQDALSKAAALQDNLEEVREEMHRQRLSADEREEMLQAEIAALQRRCSEAEARHKESESRVPEATAPLLAQVDSLRKKLDDQDALSMTAQKQFVDKIESLEKTVEALQREKRDFADETEEATSRYESLISQLAGAQQKAGDAERVAAEERLAKQRAEASLSVAQAELDSIESAFKSRIDALATSEATLKSTIRELEEELIREREHREQDASNRERVEAQSQRPGTTQPHHQPHLQILPSTTSLFTTDNSDESLRRKLRALEETKEKLSEALVKAEQRAAAGDSANKELASVRKKLVAALEVIGEKEETIDELRADLADIKDILASQQDQLANAISQSLGGTTGE